jgi:hypothetical protein
MQRLTAIHCAISNKLKYVNAVYAVWKVDFQYNITIDTMDNAIRHVNYLVNWLRTI